MYFMKTKPMYSNPAPIEPMNFLLHERSKTLLLLGRESVEQRLEITDVVLGHLLKERRDDTLPPVLAQKSWSK